MIRTALPKEEFKIYVIWQIKKKHAYAKVSQNMKLYVYPNKKIIKWTAIK
jgi:hypothetical protein